MNMLEVVGIFTLTYIAVGLAVLGFGLLLEQYALRTGGERLFKRMFDYFNPVVLWPVFIFDWITGDDLDDRET